MMFAGRLSCDLTWISDHPCPSRAKADHKYVSSFGILGWCVLRWGFRLAFYHPHCASWLPPSFQSAMLVRSYFASKCDPTRLVISWRALICWSAVICRPGSQRWTLSKLVGMQPHPFNPMQRLQ